MGVRNTACLEYKSIGRHMGGTSDETSRTRGRIAQEYPIYSSESYQSKSYKRQITQSGSFIYDQSDPFIDLPSRKRSYDLYSHAELTPLV